MTTCHEEICLLVTNSESYEQLAKSIDHELCIIQSVKHRAPPLLACRHHRKCPASVRSSLRLFLPFRCGGERTKRGEARRQLIGCAWAESRALGEMSATRLFGGQERRVAASDAQLREEQHQREVIGSLVLYL